MRLLASGPAIGLVAFGLAFQGDEPRRLPVPPGVPATTPEPDWQPRPGERATVANETPGCAAAGPFSALLKSIEAGDSAGIREVVDRGGAFLVPRGTDVLVVRYHGPERLPSHPRVMSTGGFFDQLQNARIKEPEPAFPVEVRIMDGPLRGRLAFVSDRDVAKLVPNPRPWIVMSPGTVAAVVDPAFPVAADPETYRAMKRAYLAGDDKAIDLAIRKGRAFRLQPASRVVVGEPASGPGLDEVCPVRVAGKGAHSNKGGLAYRGNLRAAARGR